MDLGLAGKNVVVTGGSRGIGRAIALAFAGEGADVAICARRPEPLQEVEEALRSLGVKAFARSCDLADAPATVGFLQAAREHQGAVDILVNNVSALQVDNAENAWRTTIDVDLLGTVTACRTVLPWMIEAGGGSIVNIASISGLEATPSEDYAYASIKAALIAYTNKVAVNHAARGIRANSVAPGSIEFEGGAWAQARREMPGFYEMVRGTIPSGRLGTPEEVADTVVFIASERARWVTGACLVVDGGQHKANL